LERSSNNYSELVRFLLSTRRFLLELAVVMAVLTGGYLCLAPHILAAISRVLGQQLVFFDVAEPVVAVLKSSIVLAVITVLPWFFIRLSNLVARQFGLKGSFSLWTSLASLFLFYAGAAFASILTLPLGIKFLLGFQSERLKATISVLDFVDFVTLFTLGFGFIFELPLVMTVLARLGVVRAGQFASQRGYAFLGIVIIAAILTPTPDAVNLSLMALPLYLLYEAGIIASRIFGKIA